MHSHIAVSVDTVPDALTTLDALNGKVAEPVPDVSSPEVRITYVVLSKKCGLWLVQRLVVLVGSGRRSLLNLAEPRVRNTIELLVNRSCFVGHDVIKTGLLFALHDHGDERVAVFEVLPLALLSLSEREACGLTADDPRTSLDLTTLHHRHYLISLIDLSAKVAVLTKSTLGSANEPVVRRVVGADIQASSLTTEYGLADEVFVVATTLHHLLSGEVRR